MRFIIKRIFSASKLLILHNSNRNKLSKNVVNYLFIFFVLFLTSAFKVSHAVTVEANWNILNRLFTDVWVENMPELTEQAIVDKYNETHQLNPAVSIDCYWVPATPGAYISCGDQKYADGTQDPSHFRWAINYFDCPNGKYNAHTPPLTNKVSKEHRFCADAVDIEKNYGDCSSCPDTKEGNPINIGTGNKYQVETDYQSPAVAGLTFRRYYNSQADGITKRLGVGWRADYWQRIIYFPEIDSAQVIRPDGKRYGFRLVGSTWTADADVVLKLDDITDTNGDITGWLLTLANDTVEEYEDINGETALPIEFTDRNGFVTTLEHELPVSEGGSGDFALDRVTDNFGRTLTFHYDSNKHLTHIVDPAGNEINYEWDSNNNITEVIFPDDTPLDDLDNPRREFHYENTTFVNHLTGITDENGNRYATYTYDTEGRATQSKHSITGGDVNKIDVVYNTDGTVKVTDDLGKEKTYTFEKQFGVVKVADIDETCSGCTTDTEEVTYDANGFVDFRKDHNGNETVYVNNSRGLQTSRTEADETNGLTGVERTITTEWHASFRLPTKITETGKETTFTYDTVGRLLTRTEKDTSTLDTRTTTNTYFGASESSPEGLLKSIDGPLTGTADTTTFDYDSEGNLIKTTNALGHVTEVTSYNDHGQPLTIEDPNGTVTTLTYDKRLRLLTRAVDSQTTTFEYDGVGNITKTILPNGSFLINEYDKAQRLTAVEDNLGNRIEYTLDDMGNRTKEDVKDPNDTLTRTLSRTYDSLSQLIETLGGASQKTTYSYDDNGNQTKMTVDPTPGLNQETDQAFDALNRLITTTDAANGVTTYDYDDRDNLTSVEDPEGLTTTYTYDGLDNLTQQLSPDTGTTSFTYDDAGNRLTQTDAKSIVTTYTYDALNRLTTIVYPEVSPGVASPLDVTYTYDDCTNGIGRLCQMTDESGTTSYTYDARGNVTSQASTMNGIVQTTSYTYNGADQITKITYPGSRTVDYTYNTIGQVSQITTTYDGTTETVASSITYEPFGPLASMSYGNGLTHDRTYDDDYRLTDILTQNGSTLQNLDYTLDKANNITDIVNVLDNTRNQTFDYNLLNRLTDADGIYADTDYTYDANGNRETSLQNSVTDTYTYAHEDGTVTDSHRLLEIDDGTTTQTFTYDANGNTIGNGSVDFVYGDNNRIKEAKTAGTSTVLATYTYNGRGERVKKVTSTDTIYYHYDQSGQLIAETGVNGETLREYLYLNGEPIALTDISNQSATPETFDNDTCGFIMTGDWTTANAVSGHEGANYRQASAGTGLWRADWSCSDITAGGLHRVYVKWTADSDRATNAKYTITHTGGSTTVTVNQKENGGQFNYLGTFDLDTSSRISLSDNANGVVVADAVKVMNIDSTTSDVAFIHTDHLGTPQLITNGSKTVVWQADYEPFGKASITTGTITNNLRFPGQYYDDETGLHYNYFRYYDPSIGRYITSDPIGLSGGMNTYLYASANPVRFIDPNGLEPLIPIHITDAFFASLEDAYTRGYYECLFNCLLDGVAAPLVTLTIGEALTGIGEATGAPESAARRYHTDLRKDGRFKAGGRHSKVLVPNTAKVVRQFGKGMSVISFLIFYKQLYDCVDKCLECSGY